MPPPARGCLRSEGFVVTGQAGVAGAVLARDSKGGPPGTQPDWAGEGPNWRRDLHLDIRFQVKRKVLSVVEIVPD